MLPPSFQAPVGIILVLGGLLACFAGYRVFRVVLGIYGFILGALMTSSAMGADQTWHMVLGAIVGGLIGAVVLILAYFVGVALIGGGLGALVANVIWASFGREPGLIVVILFATSSSSRPRTEVRRRRSWVPRRSWRTGRWTSPRARYTACIQSIPFQERAWISSRGSCWARSAWSFN
jgi:hypothetical protein